MANEKTDLRHNTFSLMINVSTNKPQNTNQMITYDNLTKANIQKVIATGTVQTDGYVFLFLYEQLDAAQFALVSDFFIQFGARLNNRLKAETPLFTVYSKDVYEQWERSLRPEYKTELSKQFQSDDNVASRYGVLQRLALNYDVYDQLPALVIIDGKSTTEDDETYTAVSFNDCCSASDINTKISSVFDVIDDNPNDFKTICNVFGTAPLSKRKTAVDILDSLNVVVIHHLEKSRKTLEQCANAIGCTRGTLRSWLNNKPGMPLERIYQLAFYLHLSGKELDNLLFYAKITPVECRNYKNGYDRRYNIIRDCLSRKMSDMDTADLLKEKHLEQIMLLNNNEIDDDDDDD